MDRDGELARRAWDRAEDRYARQINAAMESGRTAIYAALLLNGGASVGLLWFLASAFSAAELSLDKLNYLDWILRSTRWFAVGAFLAACASGLGYLFNHLQAESLYRARYTLSHPYIEDTRASVRLRRAGFALLLLSVGLVVASLVLFLVGLNSVLRHF
jgi:hypothetical protein